MDVNYMNKFASPPPPAPASQGPPPPPPLVSGGMTVPAGQHNQTSGEKRYSGTSTDLKKALAAFSKFQNFMLNRMQQQGQTKLAGVNPAEVVETAKKVSKLRDYTVKGLKVGGKVLATPAALWVANELTDGAVMGPALNYVANHNEAAQNLAQQGQQTLDKVNSAVDQFSETLQNANRLMQALTPLAKIAPYAIGALGIGGATAAFSNIFGGNNSRDDSYDDSDDEEYGRPRSRHLQLQLAMANLRR